MAGFPPSARSQDVGDLSYNSNSQKQLTEMYGALPGDEAVDQTLTYDSNGNTTTDQSGKTYTYDAWNRMISVSTGSNTTYYTYDALGRRIELLSKVVDDC